MVARLPLMKADVTITPDVFRRVMGHFVTGVTVVTALDDGRPAGITVNALSSVSLEPPLVVIALDRRRFLHPIVRAAGRYGVNILSEDQRELSDCFAGAPVELLVQLSDRLVLELQALDRRLELGEVETAFALALVDERHDGAGHGQVVDEPRQHALTARLLGNE